MVPITCWRPRPRFRKKGAISGPVAPTVVLSTPTAPPSARKRRFALELLRVRAEQQQAGRPGGGEHEEPDQRARQRRRELLRDGEPRRSPSGRAAARTSRRSRARRARAGSRRARRSRRAGSRRAAESRRAGRRRAAGPRAGSCRRRARACRRASRWRRPRRRGWRAGTGFRSSRARLRRCGALRALAHLTACGATATLGTRTPARLARPPRARRARPSWRGASAQAGSASAASPASRKAWQRQPPKSRARSGQLRHGSRIQLSPRKAFMPGASLQHSASVRSREAPELEARQRRPPRDTAARAPSGASTSVRRAQPPMHGFGRSRW